MEIQVLTGGKKLTRALVSQFLEVRVEEVSDIRTEVLGFVVLSGVGRVLLLRVGDIPYDYRVCYVNWRRSLSVMKAYRSVKRGVVEKVFSSESERELFLQAVGLWDSVSKQIYI